MRAGVTGKEVWGHGQGTSRNSQTRLIAYTDCTTHLFLALRCPFLSVCAFCVRASFDAQTSFDAVYIARQNESRHLPTPASHTAFGEHYGPANTERASNSSGHVAGSFVHKSLACRVDLQAGCQPFLSSRLTKLRPAWRFVTRKALPGVSKRVMQQF